ncbi:unnamed protein product [Cunninghamella blakesleeana]
MSSNTNTNDLLDQLRMMEQQQQPVQQNQETRELMNMMMNMMQMMLKNQNDIINNNNNNVGIGLPRGVRVNAPDVFRGERTSAAVENWLYMLNNYFDLLTLDDSQKIAFAVNLLRDAALLWWKQIHDSRSEYIPSTWSEFSRSLRSEFKPSNAESLARQELALLKQTTSITEYVSKFRKVMMDLPNMHDSDAKFQFIQGLQYEAKLQVMMKEPLTLFDAYKQAEYFEMVQQDARGMTKPETFNNQHQISSSQPNNNNGVMPMDLDLVMTELNAIKQQFNNNNRYHNNNNTDRFKGRNQRDTNINCFYCNKSGHIKRHCRKRLAAIKELDRKQSGFQHM